MMETIEFDNREDIKIQRFSQKNFLVRVVN